jgi:HTH-type transcriptional regulator / antitoxin HigA
MSGAQMKELEAVWPVVSAALSVPHTKKDYEKLQRLLDQLVDEVKSDSRHPLASFMETVGVLVADYEERHFPIADASGATVLRHLIEEHGLTQSDLKEVGSQGVVSEILNGKRELNIRQIRALAKKFSVSPSVFI